MCGICGVYQYQKKIHNDALQSIVHTMNETIIHRGPDGEGIYTDGCCAIGMRRLSIIDLNTGDQPIWNDDKTLAIIFNGEIYNYQILRINLQKQGCRFNTKSDTEVVLKGFEKYGVDYLDKLEGMFAFCIYDKKNNSLFIARDRAGEKPLYYTKTSDAFVFASELKSLISTGLVKKSLNHTALSQYLKLSYIPAPLSIYENVFKLLPGHYLTVNNNGEINISEYWNLTYNRDKLVEDYAECKKMLRNAVTSSVQKCLIADVPVGTFLSGGIDSTIITGLAAQVSEKPIKTFTIGFKDKEYDESSRAELTAKKYHTDHHIEFIDYNDALEVIPTVLSNMDEPFADQSLIVTHIVSKCASKFVKAVLTGDAGDELFAGYSRYRIGYYSDLYKRLPRIARTLGKGLMASFPKKSRTARKANKLLRSIDLPLREQRINLMNLAYDGISSPLLLGEVCQNLDFIYDYYDQYLSETDEVNRILYTDFKVSLEGDMLAKVDRASMLASLETRVPLLDKSVLECVACIPGKYKMNGKNQKVIFKDTFSDVIPKGHLNAPKRGFEVPISSWERNELRSDIERILDKKAIKDQGLFDADRMESVVTDHMSGKRNRQMEVWCLYVFQKWYERNMV